MNRRDLFGFLASAPLAMIPLPAVAESGPAVAGARRLAFLLALAKRLRAPSYMLGIESAPEDSEILLEDFTEFMKYTVRPWARRVERAVEKDGRRRCDIKCYVTWLPSSPKNP